jgi:hypothetical protein
VAGISPDHGQLHFMMRGARRVARRQFPTVDLFRLVSIRYELGKGELHRLRAVDPLEDFAVVSHRYDTYQAAGWLSRFALANVVEGVPHERFFEAMCVAFRRLGTLARERDSGLPPVAVLTGVCLVYLDEGGWLAPYEEGGDSARRCRILLDMAEGTTEPPALTARNWQQLFTWAVGLLRAADCTAPELPGHAD